MIDVSIRLRRAVHLNDLVLVRRIIKNNRRILHNPNLADKANTSLHLAAKLGFLELAEFFIDAGHEDEGISRNADGETPLMLAVGSSSSEKVAEMLARRFERCIGWKNKEGADTLMLASRVGNNALLTTLLSLPASQNLLAASDIDGNTALHYASAHGHLKCIRTLLQAGASPMARNAFSWTPVSYSSTVAAEVYFRSLVQDLERRSQEMERRKGGGGVRVVDEKAEDGRGQAEGWRGPPLGAKGVGLGIVGPGWGAVGRRRAGSAE